MAALDDASRGHEEYRLRLEAEKDIRLAGLDVQRQVAEAQATVLATGLENADINIVGGDSVFFDRLVSSIALGKGVDGFVQHSETAQALAKPWLDGTSSFTDDLGRILGSVSTADVQNLTVSALLMKLMKTGGANAGQLQQLLDKAGELGLADTPLTALNGSAEGLTPRRPGACRTGDGSCPAVPPTFLRGTAHDDRPGHRHVDCLDAGTARPPAGHRHVRGAARPPHRAGRRTRPPRRGAQRPPHRGVRLRPGWNSPAPSGCAPSTTACPATSSPWATCCSSATTPSRAARPTRRVGDVFALYDRDLNRLPDDAVPGLLDDPAFVREFAALHRYYRQARLLQLRRVDGKLLAVFQTGEKADDIRVLRWALTDGGRAAFLDARGDRDHVFPPSHDFEWTGRPARTTSSAATRTSPSAARSSSPRSAAPSPSRSRTTPRRARASTPSPSTSRCSPSPTRTSRTRAWAP